MAKKKKRRVKKKGLIFLFVIVLLVAAGIFGYKYYDEHKAEKITPKKVDTIKGYDYTLSDNATKYYKSLFKQLKTVLEADKVDEDKYANLVVKLFVADFYNLDNKTSRNDVGGVQFVYKDYQQDFQKYATDTIYKTVESNIYGKRKQTLPIVENVSAAASDKTTFTYGDNKDDNAYVIDFETTYKKDLGYQKEGQITLIHSGKKLEIAKLTEK